MKLANMLGDRFRETPADCQIISQIFMIRGGYMKQVANGIYTLLPPARRIVRKIENIIREEMDLVDGQEVLFPVVMPANLWRESGRFDKIGSELARFKDRGGNDMV
ncbi:MAG: proline--tRNA ligase, partial [Clostridia bacterium]|nr:proline--tRNA ligase [Clostridia bacterium]